MRAGVALWLEQKPRGYLERARAAGTEDDARRCDGLAEVGGAEDVAEAGVIGVRDA